MCFELTWVLEELIVIHKNKFTEVELFFSDVAIVPRFLLLFFHVLMEAHNEAFFLPLNQLCKSFFYDVDIYHFY